MSYAWSIVRGGSANPSSLKFAALMNKQNIAENELFKPDSQQPTIISAHTEDIVLIQDPFMFGKVRPKTIHYRGPFEPDGVYLKFWGRFNHLGRLMKDYSFSGNYPRPRGNPKLCEGPDFDAVKGASIVTKLNHNPDIFDYFLILNPDETGIGMSEATVGFSMFFRFMVEGPITADNGMDPRLWFHIEDPNGDNGTQIKVATDGSIRLIVRRSAVTRSLVSAANMITPGVWQTLCMRYNFTGDVIGGRLNNIPLTDTGDDNPSFPSSHENSVFMGVGSFQDKGRFVGRINDIRWYCDLIFSDDHMDNIWNNGRSICASNVISLDGTNDYIDLTNDASLWSKPLTKFAWSLWVYPTVLASGGVNRDILRHGNSGAGRFRADLDGTTSGDAKFYIRNNADTTESTARVAGMVTNKWQQLIGSYDNGLGSDNVRLYRNGVLGYQTANHTETKNLSATFTLSEASTDFQGYYKDFRWWSNDAFNTAEAELFWNTGVMPSTPDYWLKMVTGNGNPIDFITRTKVGTLTNGAVWAIGSDPRPIEFGSLAVAGYSRFNDTVDAGGFDSTGFDSTGFDTT